MQTDGGSALKPGGLHMGIDVMSILTKMRMMPVSFRVEIEGERNPTPPQYYKAVNMVRHIAGKTWMRESWSTPLPYRATITARLTTSLRPGLSLTNRYVLDQKDPPA